MGHSYQIWHDIFISESFLMTEGCISYLKLIEHCLELYLYTFCSQVLNRLISFLFLCHSLFHLLLELSVYTSKVLEFKMLICHSIYDTRLQCQQFIYLSLCLYVKVEQGTHRLEHHQVFSIANIQDKTQRGKQGVWMHWRNSAAQVTWPRLGQLFFKL